MLLQGVCLAILVALQLANGIPLQNEKIEPVLLNHFCMHSGEKGKESNKSDILLLHGLTGSMQNWDGVYEVLALETERRVCVVDLRNHGDSPWNDRSDVAAMAADIGNFLDTQDIKKVNIIGHSLGGKIAVHYTLNNPERVSSLIVEDMRPNGITEAGLKLITIAAQLLQAAIKTVPEDSTVDEAQKIVADFINAKIKELGFEGSVDKRTAQNLAMRCDDGPCRYKMNVDLLQKALKNIEEILTTSSGSYKGPALFIYGTRSIFNVAGDKSNILKLFPNAKLVGVNGAGHQIHGQFREFNDEVIRHLNNLKD